MRSSPVSSATSSDVRHSKKLNNFCIVLYKCKPRISKILLPLFVAINSFLSTSPVSRQLQLSRNHCNRTQIYCRLNGTKPFKQKKKRKCPVSDLNLRPPRQPNVTATMHWPHALFTTIECAKRAQQKTAA